MNLNHLNPWDRFGYFQTAGICLVLEFLALLSLLVIVSPFALCLFIFFHICFWGAMLGKFQIKDLL